MKKCAVSALLLLIMLITMVPVAAATEADAEPAGEVIEIWTVEDLRAMADNPLGEYILMTDLDMTGEEWKPIDFRGTFDGNGNAILNLNLTQPGDETGMSYDGNEKGYQTQFVGLFGILRNASVRNLNLINVRSVMDVDYPCFVGGIAGYCDNSSITCCTVTGTLELRAFKDIYGVGGVAGYGIGRVESCDIDVTLITVDTDTSTLAEQFLGGVHATGFIDSKDNTVHIDGYISEYGYVHSGGLTGLYMQMPLGRGVSGRQTGNTVTGQITFFEKNKNRRAYCAAYAGETLALTYVRGNNEQKFQRKEIWTGTDELRPCSCAHPEYHEEVFEASCEDYGYTLFECLGCGYKFRSNYTVRTHENVTWAMVQEPSVEEEGLSMGTCEDCGAVSRRVEPKLDPPPTTEATEPPVTEPVVEKKPVKLNWQVPVMGSGFLFLLFAAVVLGKDNRKKKNKKIVEVIPEDDDDEE